MSTNSQPRRCVQVLNDALHEIFSARDDVVLLGEDVLDPYGGAFKVTQGLSDAFPDRVLTTPISEAALFGVAAGMALRGRRPILEIMFGDFVALGMDQIVNGIAKFREMYDDQVTVPLVVRTPMGGRRGYGPTHSQSLEKLLLGVPNITVVAASECHDLRGLLVSAVEDDGPVFFVENKLMYGRPNRRPEGGHVGELAVRENGGPYPAISFSGNAFDEASATIVTYGGMLPVVLEAATELILEHEIFCEVVALSQLLPVEIEPVLDSVARTGALVTAEEGTLTGGFGAELAARVSEVAWGDLRRPVRRVAARDGIIPSARPLEDAMLPSAGDVIEAVLALEAVRSYGVLEIVLTREDANTEYALLAEWLVEDRAEVSQGDPVCVVETTKATVEVEAPGAGTIVQLYEEGVEVELGKTIAYVAESSEELRQLDEGRTDAAALESPPTAGERKATRKALELAARHGIDLSAVEKRGFITERDVEELLASQVAESSPAARPLLAGIPLGGVTLPASFDLDDTVGRLDPAFLETLRSDPAGFAGLRSEEKLRALGEHGAAIGEGVELGEGSVVVAPQVVLEDGVRLGPGADVRCEEIVAIGELTQFGPGLELRCRRAFLGRGVWGGRSVRFGGGGHRDPWAVLAVGDLAFVGDEAFVNVCRPVLVGREAFLTMRSLIVTHNIGHSLLEGFENRFAPVVLEDRSQIGLGVVVYAGCRVGAEAIVASGSYVTSDVAGGAFAIGVPAKVTGTASHALSRPRQVELARRMIDDLHELLALRGHAVSAIEEGEGRGFEVEGTRVVFVPAFRELDVRPAVVLTLESRGEAPEGVAVLDLLARRVHGSGGVVLASVREFCRKRGIRFEPGPWRYPGSLI